MDDNPDLGGATRDPSGEGRNRRSSFRESLFLRRPARIERGGATGAGHLIEVGALGAQVALEEEWPGLEGARFELRGLAGGRSASGRAAWVGAVRGAHRVGLRLDGRLDGGLPAALEGGEPTLLLIFKD